VIPHRPRCITPAKEVFKVLLFFEGVHAGPIAVMRVGHQAAGADQPPERFFHQFLAVLHVTEYLLAQHHEPAINPRAGFRNVLDASDTAAGLHEIK
jgi:hypothetical protein